jgi:ubiquinone/menaquinone biosynthesis C-methylase UbiE/uncharacterized protein YbaR (Trm112 family)
VYCQTSLTLLPVEQTDVSDGLLICPSCKRFYPIRESIPELLPDHLRNFKNDEAFLDSFSYSHSIRESLYNDLKQGLKQRPGIPVRDEGQHYKESEMNLKEKVEDPGFYGPGYVAPFNPGDPFFTINLLKRFSNVLSLLDMKPGDAVLDIGCGYFWTTEWLMKIGFEAVGVDITRTYFEVGMKRTGNKHPHLIIADVEHLPVQTGKFKSVLCYDAFHHIPDRKKAMFHFDRILEQGGTVVLAEPGKDHEKAQVSIDVMNKFGILEKGMDLSDVEEYSKGLNFSRPVQHKICKIEKEKSSIFVFSAQRYVDSCIYTLKKGKRDAGKRVWKDMIRNLKFIKRLYSILYRED